jgi:hypothetical protein
VACSTLVPVRISTPRGQHLGGDGRQPGVKLGHDLWRNINQHPAQLVAGPAGPAARRDPGEQLQLGRHLGARVAGAHHHEGAARVPFGPIIRQAGQLDLAEQVIPQVHRLGQAPEPVRVVGHTGDGQQPPPPATAADTGSSRSG